MRRSSFVLSLGAYAAAATERSTAQSTPTPMIVAPNISADQVVFYYALQSGLFAKAGLDVTSAPASSGSAGLLSVVGGAAHAGFSNTLSLSVAHAKGISFVVVAPAALYESSAPLARIMVSADSSVQSARDLDGRTIAVAGLHDLLALATTAWLAQSGIDISRVRYVEMPASSMLAALQAKRVDALTIYEPYLIAAENAGARTIGKPYDAIALEFEPGLWFASSAWASQHRDATLRFAATMQEASVYVGAHYDDLLPMVNSFSKIDVDTLRKMPPPRFPAGVRSALIQPVIDTAAKFHELPAAFRAQEMIFPGLGT